jgi:RNA polymerase sigma-70 factor (ECF subfamily)
MMDDQELVIACRNGSSEALTEVYQRHKQDLLLLALALLNDHATAEDAVHDVFVHFVQHLDRLQATGSVRNYLLVCLVNRVRNLIKARQRRQRRHETVVSDAPNSSGSRDHQEPVQTLIVNEQMQKLAAALAQLPYEQREVVMLHMHGQMSLAKIARMSGLVLPTVKSRYQYALKKLRSLFDGEVDS